MFWKYLRSHWFSIALGCIVLLAIARKSIHLGSNGGSPPVQAEKTEKYTELASAHETRSQMGFFSGAAAGPGVSSETVQAFLARFKSVAISEKKKYGIPASVILGTACLNSYAGQRSCCASCNNYFGLACSNTWEGPVKKLDGRCFRRYETPWESYRDFSIYLSSQDWFGALRKSAGKDWKAWVSGLQTEEISDAPDFREELRKLIEAYDLGALDQM